MTGTAPVLRVLAELVPPPAADLESSLRVPTEWFSWLPISFLGLVGDPV